MKESEENEIINSYIRTLFNISVSSIIIACPVLYFLINWVVADLNKLYSCRNNLLPKDDCKYAGLASFISIIPEILILVLSITVLVVTINKFKKLCKIGRPVTHVKIIAALPILICSFVILLLIGATILRFVAWS